MSKYERIPKSYNIERFEKDLYYNSRRLPVIGPWISRGGQVYDIFSTPCSTSPEIWISAAFHGLPRLLVSLLKPDSFDLVTARAGLAHKKKTKKVMEFLEELVGKIPPPKNPIARQVWNVVIPLGAWAERIGWYMLVVDATTEYAVHWTSTAYQWAGCTVPNAPFANLECNNHDSIIGLVHRDWRKYAWFDTYSSNIFIPSDQTVVIPQGYDASFGFNFSLQPMPGFPMAQGVRFRVRDIQSNRTLVEIEPYEAANGHFYGSAIYRDWDLFGQPKAYEVDCYVESGYALTYGTQLHVYGVKDRGVLSDP